MKMVEYYIAMKDNERVLSQTVMSKHTTISGVGAGNVLYFDLGDDHLGMYTNKNLICLLKTCALLCM